MAAWAKEPMTVVEGKIPILFMTVEALLRGLREEYTPDIIPMQEMFKDGQVIRASLRGKDGKWHHTLRGWVQSLRGRRSHGHQCDEAAWRLEEAFLELYPPFGQFSPPTRVPWTPGMVKSGSRIPTVEYSLTSVFDSHILSGRGGWEAFHRLISLALWNELEGKKQRESLQNIWKEQLVEPEMKKSPYAALYNSVSFPPIAYTVAG